MSASTCSWRRLLLLPLLFVVVASVGCGKRGALYLPAPEQQDAPVVPTERSVDEGDKNAPASSS